MQQYATSQWLGSSDVACKPGPEHRGEMNFPDRSPLQKHCTALSSCEKKTQAWLLKGTISSSIQGSHHLAQDGRAAGVVAVDQNKSRRKAAKDQSAGDADGQGLAGWAGRRNCGSETCVQPNQSPW